MHAECLENRDDRDSTLPAHLLNSADSAIVPADRNAKGDDRGDRCWCGPGGTAINYTLVDREEKFLVEGLCEHPALSKQGPDVCLQQIADGLKGAVDSAGVEMAQIVAIGLDTPGPASAAGQLSLRGSTNFVHADWAGFDIREGLAKKLGIPVTY